MLDKNINGHKILTCVELWLTSGVGSKTHTSLPYAAAILPVSVEQSTHEICMLSWQTPGITWTLSNVWAKIIILHPAAYAWKKNTNNEVSKI